MMGVRVVNASWGGYGYVSYLEDAVQSLATADGLLVAAAGNDSSDNETTPHYPSSYDVSNVVAVAATTASGVAVRL